MRSTIIGLAVLAAAAVAVTAPAAFAGPPQWRIQATTNPAGSSVSNDLTAVSCPSATRCLAVGYTRTGGRYTAIAESWDGTSWTTTASPAPPGVLVSALQGVSCVSDADCFAVGLVRGANGAEHALAERWSGTGWTLLAAPDPAGSQSPSFTGISCISPAYCEAVGSYTATATGTYTDLAEVWNGVTWTVQPTHAAFSKMEFSLASVSCTSPSSCLATGQYVSAFGGTSHTATWAERWDGTGWTGMFPDVNGTASTLTGVSCTAGTGDCTTVGWYRDASGNLGPLAERWNGSAWTLQSPASSALAGGIILTGVSCPAANACMAVGYALVPASGPSASATVAESWNGSSWTLGNTPDAALANTLSGVSCPSAPVCTAAGYSNAGTAAGLGPAATLAERYS